MIKRLRQSEEKEKNDQGIAKEEKNVCESTDYGND